jgi:uncharacterized membrane protein YcaP (DUF421 family)
MTLLSTLFGEGRDLDALQMSARALTVFFIVLVLIRIAGRRALGQRSPFDYSIGLLLGAVLSRAVVGASPFLPTVAACLVLVAVHRLLAWLGTRYPALEQLVEGSQRELYRHARLNSPQLRKALITQRDLLEAVRQQTGMETLEHVEALILERNGQISVIRS